MMKYNTSHKHTHRKESSCNYTHVHTCKHKGRCIRPQIDALSHPFQFISHTYSHISCTCQLWCRVSSHPPSKQRCWRTNRFQFNCILFFLIQWIFSVRNVYIQFIGAFLESCISMWFRGLAQDGNKNQWTCSSVRVLICWNYFPSPTFHMCMPMRCNRIVFRAALPVTVWLKKVLCRLHCCRRHKVSSLCRGLPPASGFVHSRMSCEAGEDGMR